MIAYPRGAWSLWVGAAAALLLGSSHAVAAAGSCEARAMARHEAIRAEALDNWEPVDERTLLIWASGSARAHLVRLDRPLAGLTSAAIVVLVDPDHDRVISPCGDDGIAIGAGEGQRALITSMELLSEKRTAELDRDAPSVLRVLNRA